MPSEPCIVENLITYADEMDQCGGDKVSEFYEGTTMRSDKSEEEETKQEEEEGGDVAAERNGSFR